MNSLFNTQDGELFEGVQTDINKAKKGTPQYEEWLRKFKEKRSATKSDETPKLTKEQQRLKASLELEKNDDGSPAYTKEEIDEIVDSQSEENILKEIRERNKGRIEK